MSTLLFFVAFGSTHTINPLSTRTGFCDDINEPGDFIQKLDESNSRSNLACLDELIDGIENSNTIGKDPWLHFPALKSILKDRVDWDTTFPTFTAQIESCRQSDKPPCKVIKETFFNPKVRIKFVLLQFELNVNDVNVILIL